jgi:hypothetical protein
MASKLVHHLFNHNNSCHFPVDSNILFAGVVAVDVTVEKFKEVVLDTKILESGYAYVIDQNALVFMHPKQDVTKPPENLGKLEFEDSQEQRDFERVGQYPTPHHSTNRYRRMYLST